jgi:hypothetical protein
MTRLVSEHDQTHIRSPCIRSVPATHGCTNIPLAAGKAQDDETILISGCSGHAIARFVYLDLPGLIGSWEITEKGVLTDYAVFRIAPSMTTPAVTYFQSATSSLRANATIAVLRKRPPLRSTRSLNQRLSAESG